MKIICIGRNYSEHAKELNNAVPDEPVIFLKPETAALKNNAHFFYPEFSSNIHYEAELIIRIDKQGKYIPEKYAHEHYSEVSLGIDFTARDLQQKQKDKALPWEIAKAFDHSAVLGKMIKINQLNKNAQDINFKLFKNKELVQNGNAQEMIFSIDKIIDYVSKFFFLKKGDLIFTGTPKGVGPIAIGDIFEGYIEDEQVFSCSIK